MILTFLNEETPKCMVTMPKVLKIGVLNCRKFHNASRAFQQIKLKNIHLISSARIFQKNISESLREEL